MRARTVFDVLQQRSVGRTHLLREIKTQAGAGANRLGREEGIEYAVADFLRDSRRKSTSSETSSLASSQPATSAKVTLLLASSSIRARENRASMA